MLLFEPKKKNKLFQNLTTFLSADVAAILPAARSTLRQWIVDECEEPKIVWKAEVAASLSEIHISFHMQ